MTAWEKEQLCLALYMRISYIETGDPVLRQRDVHNQMHGASKERRDQLVRLLKPLTSEQMANILKLEALVQKISLAKATDG